MNKKEYKIKIKVKNPRKVNNHYINVSIFKIAQIIYNIFKKKN